MNTLKSILRNNKYLLFSISLLCSCHASTGKDSSLTGRDHDTNTVTPKPYSAPKTENASHMDTVLITDMKFLPEVIKVHKGDFVVWVNKDLVVHNVTELNGKGWASPPLHSGASWKLAVKQPADYNCSIHPEMKGKIILE